MITISARLLTSFLCQADIITVSLVGEQGPVENTGLRILKYQMNRSQRQAEHSLFHRLMCTILFKTLDCFDHS